MKKILMFFLLFSLYYSKTVTIEGENVQFKLEFEKKENEELKQYTTVLNFEAQAEKKCRRNFVSSVFETFDTIPGKIKGISIEGKAYALFPLIHYKDGDYYDVDLYLISDTCRIYSIKDSLPLFLEGTPYFDTLSRISEKPYFKSASMPEAVKKVLEEEWRDLISGNAEDIKSHAFTIWEN